MQQTTDPQSILWFFGLIIRHYWINNLKNCIQINKLDYVHLPKQHQPLFSVVIYLFLLQDIL